MPPTSIRLSNEELTMLDEIASVAIAPQHASRSNVIKRMIRDSHKTLLPYIQKKQAILRALHNDFANLTRYPKPLE